MGNEPEKMLDEQNRPVVVKCFALHCKNNNGGKCACEKIYILVNGMCDCFTIRARSDQQCS